MGKYEKAQGTDFKPWVYRNACTVLTNHPTKITSGAEARELVRFVECSAARPDAG